MSGHRSKLGRKQEDAVIALLVHRNVEEAAKAINISAKSIYRWLKHPEFAKAYRAARRAAYSQSVARLQQASSAATTTLLKLMVDPAVPPAARLRAVDLVFTHGAKALEIEDIEARVSELERGADASSKKD